MIKIGGRGASSSKSAGASNGGMKWSRWKKVKVLGAGGDGRLPTITSGPYHIIQNGEEFVINVTKQGEGHRILGGVDSLERAKTIVNAWDNPTKKWQADPDGESFVTGKAGVGNGKFIINKRKDGLFMVYQQKEKMINPIGREKTLKNAKSFVEVYDKFREKM